MSRWPDNGVWEPKDAYNRAPRPALTECEPSRKLARRLRITRWVVKFVLFGGFFVVVMIGLFYFAR
jgi:hypothetical protein